MLQGDASPPDFAPLPLPPEVLWEAAPLAVTITDSQRPDHPIVYCNRAFEQLTAYPRAEVIGRNCRFLQKDDVDPLVRATVREGLRDARKCSVVLRNYRKDGRPFWNRLEVAPIAAGDSRPRFFIGVQQDVSYLVALEERLEHRAQFETVGLAASTMAHDLNNMLTIINSSADLVIDEQLTPHAARDLIGQISEAGRRARAICAGVTGYLHTGRPARERISLNELVTGCTTLLRALLGPFGRLQLVLAPDLWPTTINVSQLEQVLLNLAVNAREAAVHGRPVHVVVRTQNVCDAGGHWAQITMEDDGCGMSPEVQSHIFEPLFTTKGATGGTGLGLASVRRIIDEHQGRVFVQSTLGAGTTVAIQLPPQHR